jgi:hypothetical protein
MNWEALGAIAETVGAGGVIVTLVYLSVQIRQNTRAIRAQTYDSFVSQFRHWNEPMRVDQEMSERFSALIEDVENLPAREQRHAVHVLYDFVRLAENLHYQYREGMLAESVWLGWESLFRTYLNARGFIWYWEKRRSFFAEEFNEWVESLHSSAGMAEARAAAITDEGGESGAAAV